MKQLWEFPGGPVVRTRRFHCRGPGSIPGWGTKILQAPWSSTPPAQNQTNKNQTKPPPPPKQQKGTALIHVNI